MDSTQGSVDFVHLLVAAFNFTAHGEFAVGHVDFVDQRGIRVVEHGSQHAAHLRRPVISLGAGEDQIVFALFHGSLEQGGDALAI
jgi:hypothetical protein